MMYFKYESEDGVHMSPYFTLDDNSGEIIVLIQSTTGLEGAPKDLVWISYDEGEPP